MPDISGKYTFDEQKKVFASIAKDDPKDKIEVEIGDSKEPDIVLPQQKVMRWDNECNVSIRLKDFNEYTVYQDKDKVIFGNEKQEINIYPITEGEGGQEFEIILKEKPPTNIIEFTVVSKDLDFLYQPSLVDELIYWKPIYGNDITATDTEIKDKDGVVRVSRPENVVGSYVLKAKGNKINYEGGKIYKNGHVGIIYRPKIIDSAGTEVWGILKIENGIMSVTIPQEFLDKAVYPVRHAAGATLGYTSNGASEANFGTGAGDDYAYGQLATSDASGGTGSKISCYIRASSTAKKFVVAIYAGSTKLTNSDSAPETSNVGSTIGWVDFTFVTGPTIAASTAYKVTMQGEASTTYFRYTTSGSGFQQSSSHTYSSPLPATLSLSSGPPFQISIYATYAPAAAGPANLKTYNTNAKANIKTINTNAIANVKSLNTNV